MPPLKSEEDLLAALGLSEAEAADAIGRTRQSLYQADLAAKQKYFKKADILSLVMEAQKRNPQLDLGPVERYLAETRNANERPDLQAVAAKGAAAVPAIDEAGLRKYRDLWILIPDFGHMTRNYRDTVDMLMRLGLDAPNATPARHVRIYTAGKPNTTRIQNWLDDVRARDPHHPVQVASVEAGDWIAAFPFMILGNPQVEADSFIMTEGQYLPNEWDGAPTLVLLIEKLAAESRTGEKAPAVTAAL